MHHVSVRRAGSVDKSLPHVNTLTGAQRALDRTVRFSGNEPLAYSWAVEYDREWLCEVTGSNRVPISTPVFHMAASGRPAGEGGQSCVPRNVS
jgi:hypothetical protein